MARESKKFESRKKSKFDEKNDQKSKFSENFIFLIQFFFQKSSLYTGLPSIFSLKVPKKSQNLMRKNMKIYQNM